MSKIENNQDLKNLTKAVNNLAKKRFIKMYESRWMFFWYNIYKGILTGFGTVIGATVVIALLLHLSTYLINWPIIGDFLLNFFDIINQYGNTTNSGDLITLPTPTPTTN